MMVATAGVLSAAVITVPDDQPSIVAAVAAAAPGDTIQVRPGNFLDQVNVGKDNLTIVGLGGRPVFTAANRKDGFRVRGVSGVFLAVEFQNRRTGVNLSNCSGCAVVDMVVSGGRLGIRVSHHSDGSLVAGSSVSGVQHGNGIFVNTSANVVIDNNTVTTSNRGFRVRTVDPVTITNGVTPGRLTA
jgi:hypothetical protein